MFGNIIFDRFKHFEGKRELLEKAIPNYSLVPCIYGTLNLYVVMCTKFEELHLVNSVVTIDPNKSPDAKWVSYHTLAVLDGKVQMLCYVHDDNLNEGLYRFNVQQLGKFQNKSSSFLYPWKIKYFKTNKVLHPINPKNLVTYNVNLEFSDIISEHSVVVFACKTERYEFSKLKNPQFLLTIDISKSPDLKKIHWFSIHLFSKNTGEAKVLVDACEKITIPKGLITLHSKIVISKKLKQKKDELVIPFVYLGYWYLE